MSYTILIQGTALGEPSDFDNSYVVEYDPTLHREDGSYDGGMLRVTRDPARARRFATAQAAAEYWRQPYGVRPDGHPNRPLTAFTVEISQRGGDAIRAE